MLTRQPSVYSMTTNESTIDLHLGDTISKAVAAKLTPDFVEKQVLARVDKLIADAVDSALQTYSPTGKVIRHAVEQALKVDSLDLPSYGVAVSAMLREQIQALVSPLIAGRLAQDMEELLKLAPAEVKLSDIANAMLEEHDEDAYGELITVIVEPNQYSSGGYWIYLDADEVRKDHEKYACAHRLGVDGDGKIYGATIAGADTKKSTRIGRAYGFEQKLRAYVACGTKLIIDEDYVSRGKGDY